MNIALDFDDTYTKDPEMWDEFIVNARSRGHRVFVVTMRGNNENEAPIVRDYLGDGKTDGIYFTNRAFKRQFVEEHSLRIDVWIDDTPEFITGL